MKTHFRGVAKGGGQIHALILADQSTLFKQGGQIMPFTLMPAPRIQKATYSSTPLHFEQIKTNDNFDGKYSGFVKTCDELFIDLWRC